MKSVIFKKYGCKVKKKKEQTFEFCEIYTHISCNFMLLF